MIPIEVSPGNMQLYFWRVLYKTRSTWETVKCEDYLDYWDAVRRCHEVDEYAKGPRVCYYPFPTLGQNTTSGMIAEKSAPELF